jgi:hypothetical protein
MFVIMQNIMKCPVLSILLYSSREKIMREGSRVAEQWIFKLSGQSVRDILTRFGDRCRQNRANHRKSIRTLQWK